MLSRWDRTEQAYGAALLKSRNLPSREAADYLLSTICKDCRDVDFGSLFHALRRSRASRNGKPVLQFSNHWGLKSLQHLESMSFQCMCCRYMYHCFYNQLRPSRQMTRDPASHRTDPSRFSKIIHAPIEARSTGHGTLDFFTSHKGRRECSLTHLHVLAGKSTDRSESLHGC